MQRPASGGLVALVLLLGATLASAAEPAVDATITALDVDDSKPPVIVEIGVMLTNHSASVVKECTIELRYLDAAGKAIATKQHLVTSIDLAAGAQMLGSFQDLDLPKTWARRVEAVAHCKVK